MTAKEYLNQIRHIDILIKAKSNMLIKLKESIGMLQSPRLTDKVQSSSDGASSVRIVEKIVDLEKQIDDDIDKLIDLKRKANTLINVLSDSREKTILIEYYLNGNTYEQITDITSYSLRQVKRYHNSALDNFEKLALNGTKCP